MKFATWLGVRLRHDYYADGVCRDLSLEPTARTRALLGGYGMRLRILADGIDVAVPLAADGKKPYIALRPGEVFAFEPRVRNPDFALFTDPRDLPPGTVELAGDKRMSKPLEIRFRAQALRWAYYLVTDRAGDFSIADSAPAAQRLAFGAANRTVLNKNPDDGDAVAAALLSQYPDLQRLRFLSDQPVPCSSAARRSLELRLGSRRVLDAIPAPSIRRLSRTGQGQQTLHQVVKFVKAD